MTAYASPAYRITCLSSHDYSDIYRRLSRFSQDKSTGQNVSLSYQIQFDIVRILNYLLVTKQPDITKNSIGLSVEIINAGFNLYPLIIIKFIDQNIKMAGIRNVQILQFIYQNLLVICHIIRFRLLILPRRRIRTICLNCKKKDLNILDLLKIRIMFDDLPQLKNS